MLYTAHLEGTSSATANNFFFFPFLIFFFFFFPFSFPFSFLALSFSFSFPFFLFSKRRRFLSFLGKVQDLNVRVIKLYRTRKLNHCCQFWHAAECSASPQHQDSSIQYALVGLGKKQVRKSGDQAGILGKLNLNIPENIQRSLLGDFRRAVPQDLLSQRRGFDPGTNTSLGAWPHTRRKHQAAL